MQFGDFRFLHMPGTLSNAWAAAAAETSAAIMAIILGSTKIGW